MKTNLNLRFSFNPKISWSTNIFILNLALADLLNCIVNIPIYLVHILHQKWTWGAKSCRLTAYLRHSLTFIAWMSVALIAIHRCNGVLKLGKETIFDSKSKRRIILILVWVYGFLLLIPSYFGLFGELGYNCLSGNCYIIPQSDEFHGFSPLVVIYGLAILVPCFTVIICYCLIGISVWKTQKLFINNDQIQQKLSQRQDRTTRAVTIVCITFIVFMIPLPMTLFEYFYHLDVFLGSLPLKIGLICIYWAQYSVNFFIYAGSCHQYRQAYRNLIQKVSCYF